MATAHVYVRVQVAAPLEACTAIAEHVSAIRTLVEAAGGDWKGDVAIADESSVVEPTLVEPSADEAVSEPPPEEPPA